MGLLISASPAHGGGKSPRSHTKRNQCCCPALPFSSSRQLCTPENKITRFSTLQMKSGWLGQSQFPRPGPGQGAFGLRTWAWLLGCSDRALGKVLLQLKGNAISPMHMVLESWHCHNIGAQWNSELTSLAILCSFKAQLQKGAFQAAAVIKIQTFLSSCKQHQKVS